MAAPKLTLQDLEAELLRRKRQDPIGEVYTPTDQQLKVHRARNPITVVLGANRAGKSTSLVVEALLYCLGRAPYAEVRPVPVDVYYVMPSMTMFERVIFPIFARMVPQGTVQSFVTKPNAVVTFSNGSRLHFLSADMKQRRLQGFESPLIIMDETPDESAFDELVARVQTLRGRVILGFAPIDQASDWVRDRLFIPWQAGDRLDVAFVEMPIANEESGESLVPWFTKEDIDRMKRQWPDPQVQAARLFGRFVTRAGTIFRNYEPEIHQVVPFALPKHWVRWAMCDPQYHRFAMLWFAADDQGNYFVTDELFSQQATLRQRAERAKVVTALRGDVDLKRPLPVYTDSANPQDIAELNWHFQELQVPLAAMPIPFQKKVDDMILRVHSMLEPDPERVYPTELEPETTFGAPRLFFFNDLFSSWERNGTAMECSRLLWEIASYTWGRGNKPNKDSADGADACDCLVYGCSIMAQAIHRKNPQEWRYRLSPRDVLLWDTIDAADRRKELIHGRDW